MGQNIVHNNALNYSLCSHGHECSRVDSWYNVKSDNAKFQSLLGHQSEHTNEAERRLKLKALKRKLCAQIFIKNFTNARINTYKYIIALVLRTSGKRQKTHKVLSDKFSVCRWKLRNSWQCVQKHGYIMNNI